MRLMVTQPKNKGIPTGVRRIPINVRSLTGEVNGQEFESSLERDLLLLAHWDNEVEWYQSQPVRIDYADVLGKARNYTPDLLIWYKTIQYPDQSPTTRKPLLCEVKYRKDFAENWKELKPKFRAAQAYAKANNYQFRVLTEREIRTDYLKNIQFLWRYRMAPFHPDHHEKLMAVMSKMGESDPVSLLDACYTTKILRGEALWTLWCMIACGEIKCDLHNPLSMKTQIWIEL